MPAFRSAERHPSGRHQRWRAAERVERAGGLVVPLLVAGRWGKWPGQSLVVGCRPQPPRPCRPALGRLSGAEMDDGGSEHPRLRMARYPTPKGHAARQLFRANDLQQVTHFGLRETRSRTPPQSGEART